MDKPMNNFGFRAMAWMFKIMRNRNRVMKTLQEVPIKSGDKLLDYGCGPGSYSLCAAEKIGENGMVFAADIQPLAAKYIQKSAKKAHLTNIKTITTSCDTGLDKNSIDVMLLYDCIHNFNDPIEILTEMHRVLKPEGKLSVKIDHGDPQPTIDLMIKSGFYILLEQKPSTFL
ncbi:MAG: class I SAM-dependent methyltransferase, partial [Promethearchaeota archaeon]